MGSVFSFPPASFANFYQTRTKMGPKSPCINIISGTVVEDVLGARRREPCVQLLKSLLECNTKCVHNYLQLFLQSLTCQVLNVLLIVLVLHLAIHANLAAMKAAPQLQHDTFIGQLPISQDHLLRIRGVLQEALQMDDTNRQVELEQAAAMPEYDKQRLKDNI